ncbi:MAG: PmoA family protein [Acidobacteriota bacterium]|nr:PmoA family protein [Acidobacteriota bacterium]
MKRAILALLFGIFPLSAQVKIEKGANQVTVAIDGQPFTTFFYGPETGHPYLHPLRAASGTIVTRHYPMEKIEGESTDHPHHRGLWFAHSDVNGLDFWNNERSYKTPNRGFIVVKSIDSVTSGKDSGVIVATMDWQDPDGKPIMTEKRTMTFYSGSGDRRMDFDFILTPLTKVTFGDNKDGVFAIRLAAGLEEKDRKSLPSPPRTGTMVNAEGGRGEAECWGKRSDWMDYHGELEGEKVGIAILDHPANPRHPTYWHTRAYGLFAANIFGVKDFTKDKSADGSMTINPGDTLRFRYRVIIHPGDEKTANIAAAYRAYSK